jgi:hypothetical protein
LLMTEGFCGVVFGFCLGDANSSPALARQAFFRRIWGIRGGVT